MNEKTRKQSDSANEPETECCDLYDEYCYPCVPTENDDTKQEKADD